MTPEQQEKLMAYLSELLRLQSWIMRYEFLYDGDVPMSTIAERNGIKDDIFKFVNSLAENKKE